MEAEVTLTMDMEKQARASSGMMNGRAMTVSGEEAAMMGEAETVAESVSEKNVFSEYTCRSSVLQVFGGRDVEPRAHPGMVSEAAGLSAVDLPTTSFPLADAIPEAAVKSGALSSLQLESVLYACAAHCRVAGGVRGGFFLGDGTGVGKGRQIAGVICDSLCRGRRRHIWCSTSPDLHLDAIRDLNDIGVYCRVFNGPKELETVKSGDKDGILFVSYATLVSAGRLHEVLAWARGAGGPRDFDGCLIFDECHRAKNSSHGSPGSGSGTKIAQCVSTIQDELPLARVLYCSATGVSEVVHMGYLSRLGLWGPQSSFPNATAFMESMKMKGLGFLEMLAMELKGKGMYVARSLSFHNAEFMEVSCALSQDFRDTYNGAVRFWNCLKSELNTAIGKVGGESKEVLKPFWALQQRFFKLLCVSAKVAMCVEETERVLERGECVVIGIQSTGEAAFERDVARSGGEATGWHATLRSMLISFLEEHFPTTIEQRRPDRSAGGMGSAQDASELADAKSRLIRSARDLPLPNNFLDELIDRLGGPSKVAEITGRRSRLVRDSRGAVAVQMRGKGDAAAGSPASALSSLNVGECQSFLDGQKLVAIISDAASTGISLHADHRFKNKRKRVHLTIELPWSADKAIQQLGRTHRSNQVTPPLYKLIVSNIGGEKRFAAAVARRLQSLGALTRGDRRAASAIDMNSSNLDTPLGRKALSRMFCAILLSDSGRVVNGVQLSEFFAQVEELTKESEGADASGKENESTAEGSQGKNRESTFASGSLPESEVKKQRVVQVHHFLKNTLAGIGLVDPKTGVSRDESVKLFLNRILATEVSTQNACVNYFLLSFDAEIKNAKKEGKWSEGVSDLSGTVVMDGDMKPVWRDSESGAPALRADLRMDRGVPFDAALSRLKNDGWTQNCGFWQSHSKCYGRWLYLLAIAKPGNKNTFTITRPNTGENFFTMDKLDLRERYRRADDDDDVRAGWQMLYEELRYTCLHGPQCSAGDSCFFGKRQTRCTLITGSVISIWSVLERVLERHQFELSKSERGLRCVRVELEDGRRLVGVRFPSFLLAEVTQSLEIIKQAREQQATVDPQVAALGFAARRASGDVLLEEPAPINKAAMARALRPPVTMMSFFKPSKEGLSDQPHPGAPTAVAGDARCAPSRARNDSAATPRGVGGRDVPRKRAAGSLHGFATLFGSCQPASTAATKKQKAEKRRAPEEIDDDDDDEVVIVGETQTCPICGFVFPRSHFQSEINAHIDVCLSKMEPL